jgi:Helix-turn-helix domain
MIEVQVQDRIAMSQRERDRLAVLRTVVAGERTQVEAARLLKLSVRQVRRLAGKLEAEGDGALVHGLRGQPSNHRHTAAFRVKVLKAYRKRYLGFGPTLACEKLADEKLTVGVETLRRWLVAEGLWERKRHRDPHRSRRPRRSCFGELVQMDASIHDWLEGRGETLVLITMIDDATSRLMAKFYRSGSVESHMDLLECWLRAHGRPLAVYTDRHSIFEPHEKGGKQADPEAKTQFGRALSELDVALIRAHSPQAKGRVERSFGTAQDRWVKELRLAKAKTLEQANAVLAKVVPEHNKKFAKPARDAGDAHRRLGAEHRLASILSIQAVRVVSNDYVVQCWNRRYQLLPPAYPGLRGGRVVMEARRDGTRAIRFGSRELAYEEVRDSPKEPRAGEFDRPGSSSSRRTPSAETRPPSGRSNDTGDAEAKPGGGSVSGKPAANHPWRRSYK